MLVTKVPTATEISMKGASGRCDEDAQQNHGNKADS